MSVAGDVDALNTDAPPARPAPTGETGVAEPRKESNGQRFHAIEGARGVAAALVFLDHLEIPALVAIKQHCDLGKTGVVLFFFISGFLVLPAYAKRPHFKQFAVKRFFRLYPIYWVSILLAILLFPEVTPREPEKSLVDIVMNFTMFQQLLGFTNMMRIYWTLTVEMGFYIALVVVGFLNRDYLSKHLVRTFHIAGILSVAAALVRMGLERKIPIAMVMALHVMSYAAILRQHLKTPLPKQQFWLLLGWYAFYMGTCCATGYSFATAHGETTSRYLLTYSLGAGAFFFVLFAPWKRFLEARPLLLLGQISYGFYLFHLPFIEFFRHRFGDVPSRFVLPALACSLLAAYAGHRLLELPGIRIGGAIARRIGAQQPGEHRPPLSKAADHAAAP